MIRFNPICLTCDMQVAAFADSLIFRTIGNTSAAKAAISTITTRTSIKLTPRRTPDTLRPQC